MKYYVAIDLGGTDIKGGIVGEDGAVLLRMKIPTQVEKGNTQVVKNIARLVEVMLLETKLTKEDIVGLGMGAPGMVDSRTGTVILAENLNMRDFKIAKAVAARTGLKVRLANDANVATLGEMKFGAAKNRENVVMITLGTGVGGGVIADGKMVEGNRSAGAELGHTVIVAGGRRCSCGRKGCLEAYASATALIRATKAAMEVDKDSAMWQVGSLDNVTGKTAFDYAETDASAKRVVDDYIFHLACGITNFANIFRPEVVLLGGGVCAQGESLLRPLQAIVDADIFAGNMGPQVEILRAELGNGAGVLGAAALWMD